MVQDTSLNLPLFSLLVSLSLLPPHVPLCFSSCIFALLFITRLMDAYHAKDIQPLAQ